MTAKIHEKSGVFVPQNSHFSYVFSITLPQPTIRIKIPKVLVKAMQRRNQARCENDAENGGINKKKSFRKKVGAMVSTVFGKNKKTPEAGSDGNYEAMEKLKKMIESLDMGSEKITAKSSDDQYILNEGVLQQKVLVEDEETVEAEEEDEGKEEPPMVMEAGNERKERPKSRRTCSNTLSKRISSVCNNDSSVVCVDDESGNGTVGTKAGNGSNDMTWLRSRTVSWQRRKPKIAWSVKRISEMVGGKTKKQQVWRKRILMGGKCKPLNYSGVIQYDENGVLIPEQVL